MNDAPVRVPPAWLALREPADAAARDADLAAVLVRHAPPSGRWVIHDLACGTGSMGRWLAPLLPGPQHWVLHDRDPDLLEIAAHDAPSGAADGAPVTVETRRSDITGLDAAALAGVSLVTASALLDILSGWELARLLAVLREAECPVLLALSVTGRVALDPPHHLDIRVARAFNAHQRRPTSRGRLLGPDAPTATAAGLRRPGWEVHVRPSPWRLDAADGALVAEWFAGWVGAAVEQEPELAETLEEYERWRLAAAADGVLAVTVQHADVLAVPAVEVPA